MLAKSKLNSIEILISQALVDLEITDEEFVTIVKEKEKYEKMRENIKNINEKLKEKTGKMRLNNVNSRALKSMFLFCIYKIYLISAERYKNTEKIRKTDKIWVSMKNVHNGLGVKNMSDLVLKEIYGE